MSNICVILRFFLSVLAFKVRQAVVMDISFDLEYAKKKTAAQAQKRLKLVISATV